MSADGRVTVITVAYNSDAVLPNLLGSVPASAKAIVVDNGGGPGVEGIAARFNARLIRLTGNQGFGRACNAGAAVAQTEFLFFVNPDARIDSGSVETLVAAADALPDAVAFNPAMVDGKGRRHFRRQSALSDPSIRVDDKDPSGPIRVPTLLGGALFCRRAAFEKVGGFDPAIFLYHEDDDLAVRLNRDCGPLYYVPGAVVHHEGGTGSGRSLSVARLKGYHMARARAYVLAKHGHALPCARTLARAAFELLLPHNFLSARRRAKHAGQFAGAWSALKDGGSFKGD
jgi:GT2 family glycosyltransferase